MDDNNVIIAICGFVAVVLALIFPKLLPKKKDGGKKLEPVETKKEKQKEEPKDNSPKSEILKTIQDVSKTVNTLNSEHNEKVVAIAKAESEKISKDIAENNARKANNFDIQKETNEVLKGAVEGLKQDIKNASERNKANLDELRDKTDEMKELADKAGFQTQKTKEGWKNEDAEEDKK